MKSGSDLKVIVIISDGVRAHTDQSRGVALWLSRFTGAEILETEIPLLTGAVKARARSGGRRLAEGTRRDAREWLAMAEGDVIIRRMGQWFAERDIHEGTHEVLIISAGGMAALYNLAIGYIWRCACATVMIPGIVGTEPFDFAIVAEHDRPDRKPNIFVTQGAPNIVLKENLKKESEAMLAEYPAKSGKKWSVFIGGDGPDYIVTPECIKKIAGHIMKIADHEGADLYIATSQNTSPESLKTLKTMASHSSSVRYLGIEKEERFDCVTAMLGFSSEVFCTEDMAGRVFEAITAGHRVVLLRVGHKKGVSGIFKKITAALVSAGAADPGILWGGPKFDMLFDHLARHNMLVRFRDWIQKRHDNTRSAEDNDRDMQLGEFNEAKRAAKWIHDNW